MEFNWKEFNINLFKVTSHIKALVPSFSGACADMNLRLCFSEPLTEEQASAIQAYWDGITDESLEATSYHSVADIAAKILVVKEDAITKTYDQLSVVQKKILYGLNYSQDELFEI